MSEIIDVNFSRSLLVGLRTHTPLTGWVEADYEMITSISVPEHLITLFETGQQVKEVVPMSPIRQRMSREMAKRLLKFCDMTFCSYNPDYDCHTFTSFMMGWQDTVAAGSSGLETDGEAIQDFDRTKSNRPYVAHAPDELGAPWAHSFLGTERKGYGFGVAGPGMALVMSRTVDLQRTFGAKEIYVRKR
jgi:hypothetical protein